MCDMAKATAATTTIATAVTVEAVMPRIYSLRTCTNI